MRLSRSILPLLIAGALPVSSLANGWPAANPDSVVIATNESIVIKVLDNDVGEGLALVKVNDWSVNGGRASINEDGTSVTYVPRADYQGSDQFWYDFKDNQGRTNAAKVSIRIEGDVSEQPVEWPVAAEDFKHIQQHSGNTVLYKTIDVLANDTGVGLTLTSVNEWSAKGNIAKLSDDGKSILFRTYRSITEWPMVDEFWYVFEDNWGRSNAGKVKVLLSQESQPEAWPAANTDTTTTSKNSPVNIDVLGNDEGIGLSLKSVNESSLRWGRVTIEGSLLSYTPYKDFEGEDEFWYVFEDAWGRANSAKVVINVTGEAAAVSQVPLNDTGKTTCGDYALGGSENNQHELADCTATTDADGDPIPQGQDPLHGRDATDNDDSDGAAGFSFTKLDIQGNALAASAASWSCVKDNVTGLVWESKQGLGSGVGQSGLHSADDTFSWYSSDLSKNGGEGVDAGLGANLSTCLGYSAGNSETYCNTEAFVARVNTSNLCGISNWEVPTVPELHGLLYFHNSERAMDTTYFPNTTYGNYLTANLSIRSPRNLTVGIGVFSGIIHLLPKSHAHAVRLVSHPESATTGE